MVCVGLVAVWQWVGLLEVPPEFVLGGQFVELSQVMTRLWQQRDNVEILGLLLIDCWVRLRITCIVVEAVHIRCGTAIHAVVALVLQTAIVRCSLQLILEN